MVKILSLASLIVGISSIAAFASHQPPAKTVEAPKSLAEVGELGENIYDLTKAKDWTKATEKYESLKSEAKKLSGELKGAKAEKARLETAIQALDKSVAAKDRLVTLRQANQVTLIAADMNDPFNPKIPVAVTRLDYFGRELEIGVEARDKDQLKAAADGLHKNWELVKAALKGRGTAEAKTFEALLMKVKAAKTEEDYSKVAKPILDEVDNLEKVFSK